MAYHTKETGIDFDIRYMLTNHQFLCANGSPIQMIPIHLDDVFHTLTLKEKEERYTLVRSSIRNYLQNKKDKVII